MGGLSVVCDVLPFVFILETGFCFSCPDSPEILFIAQVALELYLIFLAQPPKC